MFSRSCLCLWTIFVWTLACTTSYVTLKIPFKTRIEFVPSEACVPQGVVDKMRAALAKQVEEEQAETKRLRLLNSHFSGSVARLEKDLANATGTIQYLEAQRPPAAATTAAAPGGAPKSVGAACPTCNCPQPLTAASTARAEACGNGTAIAQATAEEPDPSVPTSVVNYWKKWFRLAPKNYKADFEARLSASTPLHRHIQNELVKTKLHNQTSFTIVDVGAGPLTNVGYVMTAPPAARLEVIAVDPLANVFDKIMSDSDVTPVVRTQKMRGDDLRRAFLGDFFDLVYVQSALDHMQDPIRALGAMVAVCKPGGTIMVEGAIPGEGEAPSGKWSINVESGSMVIYRNSSKHYVDSRFAGQLASVECSKFVTGPRYWMKCVLRKAGRGGAVPNERHVAQ